MESILSRKIEISEYEDSLKFLIQTNKDAILIFKGSIDPETNLNWCSDCVDADPAIKEIVYSNAEEKGIPILEVSVGTRDFWKTPTHPLRAHAITKVNCVPTILYLQDGGVTKSVIEEDCSKRELLKILFEE